MESIYEGNVALEPGGEGSGGDLEGGGKLGGGDGVGGEDMVEGGACFCHGGDGGCSGNQSLGTILTTLYSMQGLIKIIFHHQCLQLLGCVMCEHLSTLHDRIYTQTKNALRLQ
ncbi:MAG: hypothetical protein ACKO24_10830 [Leptolyngbyaceae cyanobacterium]